MCKQKLRGEKCGIQDPGSFGPNYFDNLEIVSIYNLTKDHIRCVNSAMSSFEDYLKSCDCPLNTVIRLAIFLYQPVQTNRSHPR